MKDIQSQAYPEEHIKDIMQVIEEMTTKHDRDQNGFDFAEMYMASGGNLHDL